MSKLKFNLRLLPQIQIYPLPPFREAPLESFWEVAGHGRKFWKLGQLPRKSKIGDKKKKL